MLEFRVITILCLLSVFNDVNGFATKRLFGRLLWIFEDTKFHDMQTETALCITQYNFLKRNKGLNSPEPSIFQSCPYLQWFPTLTLHEWFNAYETVGDIVEYVEAPDRKSGMDNNPKFHFDAENFLPATNTYLVEARGTLLQAVRDAASGSTSYTNARQQLGYILHTLQDFYSHTNWIEMGRNDINRNIGNNVNLGVDINPANSEACRPCTHNELTAIENASIYDKMVWLYLWPHAKFDNVYVCHDNIIAKGLTSGYYSSERDVAPKPNAKCSHGSPADDSVQQPATGGISKDSATPITAPHYYLHQQAAYLSVQATIQYLEDLRIALGDENAFGGLIGLNYAPVMSIMIDTTGSMQPSIEAVKKYAQQMVIDAKGNEKEFYITPFNDPEYGPVLRFTDAQKLVDYIETLGADGGGDTPEKCFAALLDTVRAVPERTNIYIFTDASSKDPELKGVISSIAKQKSLHISFMMSGEDLRKSASRRQTNGSFERNAEETTMDDYKDLAVATDGTYLVARGATEISQAAQLMTQTNWQFLLLATVPVLNATTWMIDVDETVVQVEIALSFANDITYTQTNVFLIDSTGTDLLANNATFTYRNPQYVAYRMNASVNTPWKLTVNSTSNDPTVKLTVRVQSTLSSQLILYDAAYQPFDGSPLIGRDYQLVVQCQSCANVTSMRVAKCFNDTSLAGGTPKSLSDSVPWWMIENVTMPAGDDQLCVEFSGNTTGGRLFRRIAQQKLQLSTLGITGSLSSPSFNASGQVYPGENATMAWTVSHYGEDSTTFSVSVTTSSGFPVFNGPYNASLNGNSSSTGFVTIWANGSIGDVANIELTAVATNGFSATVDFTLLLVDPNPDLYAPVCTIENSTDKLCPTTLESCNVTNYEVELAMSDVGTGISRVDFDRGNWTMRETNYTIQPNKTFHAHGKISCCDSFTFNVVDGAGLVGKCEVDIVLYEPTPPTTIAMEGPTRVASPMFAQYITALPIGAYLLQKLCA